MADRATPNLPARDLAATARFYLKLGFHEAFRDDHWLIMVKGDVMLEFFPDPTVDPATSDFSCCLRFDDADTFLETCRRAGIPEAARGWPRLHPLHLEESSGLRIGALVDPDGTLLRAIQNDHRPPV